MKDHKDYTSTNFVPSPSIHGVKIKYCLSADQKEEVTVLSGDSQLIWGFSKEDCNDNLELLWKNINPEDVPYFKQSIEESAESLEMWQNEWRYNHPVHGLRWHRGIGFPEKSTDDSITWHSIITDITEEKKILSEFLQANKLIERKVKEQACFNSVLEATIKSGDYAPLIKKIEHILSSYFQDKKDAKTKIKVTVTYTPRTPRDSQLTLPHNSLLFFKESHDHKLYISLISEKNSIQFLDRDQELLDKIGLVLWNKLLLLQSEDKYSSIIQSIDGIVWEARGDELKFTYVSEKCIDIIGYTPREWLSVNSFWRDHIHEEDRDYAINYCLSQVQDLKNHEFEYRMIHKNGDTVWLRDLVTVKKKKDGTTVLRGVMIDISEEKKTESYSTLLTKVLASTKDAILITNNIEEIVYANEAFLEMTEYSFEEIRGKTPRIFQSKKTQRERLDIVRKHIDKHESFEMDLINYTKSGKEYWINISVSPIKEKTGQVSHFVAIQRDITPYKTELLKKQIIEEIGKTFSTHETVQECIDQSLQIVLKHTSFNLVEVWVKDYDRRKINLIAQAIDNPALKGFVEDTKKQIFFHINDGLPGYICREKKVHVITDLSTDSVFIRKNKAKEHKLKTFIGVPLFDNTSCIGAILLGTTDDFNTLSLFQEFCESDFGNYLGAEISRKMQEEELSMFFNHSPNILGVTGKDGKFKKVNPAFTKILGYRQEEITTTPFIDFIHPEDVAATLNQYQESLINKPTHDFENRYRTKNGDYRWIKWSSSEMFAHGDLTFAFGQDITDSKKNKELLDGASAVAMIGGWELDVDTRIINWSPEVKKILHLNAIDFSITLEVFITNFIENHERKSLEEAFELSISEHLEWDEEFYVRTPRNILKWVRIIGKPQMENGKVVKIRGSIQDINKLKKYELDLKRKTVFLSAISRLNEQLLADLNWDNKLQNCLRIMGETMGADRSYYFEYHSKAKSTTYFLSQRLEWCNKGIESQLNVPFLQNIPEDTIKLFLSDLKENRPYIGYLDEQADPHYIQLFNSGGIKSLLLQPIFVKTQLIGIIGFDDCSKNRFWTTEESNFLFTAVQNIALAFGIQNSLKKPEISLNEKEIILNSIGDGFFTMEYDFNVTYWNKSAGEITGITTEHVVGENLFDVFSDDSAELFRESYKLAIKTKKDTHFEGFFQPKKKWLEVSVYPNESNILSVYFKDITDRKRVLEEIKENNLRFELVSEATNDAIWDWNLKTDQLIWGKGFERLFGLPLDRTDVTLEKWANHIHKEDLKMVLRAIDSVIKNSASDKFKLEYRFRRYDDSYALVLDRGYIIRNKNKEPIRLVGAISDVTEQKKYEASLKVLNMELAFQTKELKESNQDLEQFAYVASHDLQEPLRMITSFLSQLDKKYAGQLDDKAKQYIAFAVDGATRMRQIILDLLEYSRIGKGLSGEKDFIPLAEVIDEIIQLNKQLIEETNATITYNNPIAIKSYKSPLLQILNNLIGNALKYRKEDQSPTITINSYENEEFWHIEVSDNGIGIEKEYFDKIFQIFQRLHPKQDYGGAGLGLAIVKKLVQNLDGKIWIESEVNKGSTFYIRLFKAMKK